MFIQNKYFEPVLQLQPTVSIMEPLVEEDCSYTQV